MRIGFQMLSLEPDTVGGLGVLIHRLTRQLLTMLEDDRLVLFLRPELASDPEFLAISADPRVETIVENPESHYGEGYASWNRRLLDKAGLHVAFFPLSFFYPRPLDLPVAVYVADIQYEYLPECFSADQLAWRRERIPESVNLADAVMTCSHFSAACMRDRLGADEDKLHVIPVGGFPEDEIRGANRMAQSVPEFSAGQPFIFYPAADWPHKNHETLLRAVAKLVERGRPEHLALTGIVSERGDALRGLTRELGLAERVHFLGRVGQGQLFWLYSNARLMAFPSRFEGFGQPLVEAMQFGCPVVASKAEGVVETAGEGAEYCDDDPEAWAKALADTLDSQQRLDDLRLRGLARAKQFDWARSAAAHLEVFRRLGS